MVEGKISFIVPCHKLYKRLDDRYEVEACIDSILDQDYDNYEIIVCANGEQRNEIATFVNTKYSSKVQVVITEPGNAAIARNAGAACATGEFRSYFSSDLTLYPGIARLWAKTFKKNPDVAIVYSEGIDWVQGGKSLDFRAHTVEYNDYMMTCGNLIDGANPVRAKDDQPWDEDVKSLQDWNWALKVLKPCTPEAKKALMIKEIFYTTEKPKEGGLSDDFSKNWLERFNYVRSKNGIQDRKICVSSLGAPLHGVRTAKLLDADFNHMPSYHEHNYEAVYLLGYYTSRIHDHNKVFNGMRRDALKIIHWIGTDVLQLMHMAWITEKNLAAGLREYIDIHICESEFVQQELGELGIPAIVAPLPIDVKQYPLYVESPKDYTVAVYTPYWDDENQRKYNLPLMVDVARAMPDFKFIFFGSKTGYPEGLPSNVETRGWVDVKEVAKDSSILLRFPFHDGLPITACEFILMGRDVAASVPMVGSYYLGSGMMDSRNGSPEYDEAKSRIITQLRNARQNPITEEQRKENKDYWQKKLDPEAFKQKISDLIAKRRLEVRESLEKALEKNNAKD